ncbi:MAG TPA: class I SAM-dependent methyltransferase [Nitrosopumilaceae archaeon]|nr:class I SAM-dependent methyltransferase [Nitrosopumilaceae archaeon]
MGYYDTKKGITEYSKRSQKWGGQKLFKILKKHLPKNSTLLEIGMGPGRDFDFLKKIYLATGSDKSKVFLDNYKQKNKKADLLKLDAVTLKTDRRFDGIYTNKVLQHLTKRNLRKSIKRQKEILNPGGIAFHTFWKGDKTEYKRGLRFVYYEKSQLKKIIGKNFAILEMKIFTEMEKNDSIYVVLKKK